MDKQAEKEIREIKPFTIVTNNITFLGVTLTKQVQDLYDKNFKSLKEEIKEDLRRWKDLPCSWIGRGTIVKIAILSKAIYRFTAIPIKIPNSSKNCKASVRQKTLSIRQKGYQQIWKGSLPILNQIGD